MHYTDICIFSYSLIFYSEKHTFLEFSSEPNQAIFRPDQTYRGPAKLEKLVWSVHQASLCTLLAFLIKIVLNFYHCIKNREVAKLLQSAFSSLNENLVKHLNSDMAKNVAVLQKRPAGSNPVFLPHSISQEPWFILAAKQVTL